MSNLRQLLATRKNWSARDTLTRALGHTSAERPTVSDLDALRDSHELVEVLAGWPDLLLHRC